MVNDLRELGVVEILLDVLNGDDYSDTLFFKTTEETNFKDLIVMIANIRPHEFSQETPHHFRMWFD